MKYGSRAYLLYKLGRVHQIIAFWMFSFEAIVENSHMIIKVLKEKEE
jgi:hypothetical protein